MSWAERLRMLLFSLILVRLPTADPGLPLWVVISRSPPKSNTQCNTPQCQAPMPCHAPPVHQCHARPSLPVNQIPNPAPPNIAPSALHDTAALFYWLYQLSNNYNSYSWESSTLLSFHRVLHERDSMKGNKVVTYIDCLKFVEFWNPWAKQIFGNLNIHVSTHLVAARIWFQTFRLKEICI